MWFKRASITIVLSLVLSVTFAQLSEQEAYIEKYKDLAIREMERYGIPASIKLAQGILESNSGRSDLATKARNHFGIKMSGNWTGEIFPKVDDDYDAYGNLIPSYFRVYRTVEDSYQDHSIFLQKPRYAELFRMENPNYKKWAVGLQQAGYATNPSYAQKLIGIIERYKLHQFDRFKNASGNNDLLVADNTSIPPGKKVELTAEASGEAGEDNSDPFSAQANGPKAELNFQPGEADISFPPLPEPSPSDHIANGILVKNDVKYIVIGQGNQTVAQIAQALKYSTSSLLENNEHLYEEDQKLATGTIVYLQPKRKSFRGKSLWHVVSEGETMLDISNMYALDLNKLLERNLLEPKQEPAPGERIKLRGKNIDVAPALAEANPAIMGQLIKQNNPKPSSYEPTGDPGKDDPFAAPASPNTRADSSGLFIPQDGASLNKPILKNTDLIPLHKLDLQGEAITVHKVERGETLWRLSRQYNTPVEKIKDFNRLESDLIREGVELRVKGKKKKK
jgi:LysM repeat protein